MQQEGLKGIRKADVTLYECDELPLPLEELVWMGVDQHNHLYKNHTFADWDETSQKSFVMHGGFIGHSLFKNFIGYYWEGETQNEEMREFFRKDKVFKKIATVDTQKGELNMFFVFNAGEKEFFRGVNNQKWQWNELFHKYAHFSRLLCKI